MFIWLIATFCLKEGWSGLVDEILGEHEIIRLIQQRLAVMPDMPIGFGDDVAAVPLGDGLMAVLKTDMLIGHTDVPKGMSLWQAAHKAVVMNVSDFASKGIQPSAALAAIGLPKNMATKKAASDIADGLNAGAQEYGCYIVGGDTNEGSDLILGISLFGVAKTERLILRSGAKVGDILAVTGPFGKTAAGLRLLLGDYSASPQVREVLVDSVLNPKARLREGLALAGCGQAVSSSMDSSDGLAWSLHELARQSDVGFVVDNLPVAPEVKKFASANKLNTADLALYGGEEYELVLTIAPKLWAEAKTAVEAVSGCLIPIGRATHEMGITLDFEGKKQAIEARGFEHFTAQE